MTNKTRQNLAKLPGECAAIHPSSGMPIYILAGERGYCDLPASFPVDSWNEKHGITNAQVEAMLAGSMFGWDIPGADPDFYR